MIYAKFEKVKVGIDKGESEGILTGVYETLAADIGRMTDSKAAQYGNASVKVEAIMKVLYPEGVPVYALRNALLITRMLDKVCRIANQGPDGLDKGGEDPFRDLAGYALIGTQNAKDAGK